MTPSELSMIRELFALFGGRARVVRIMKQQPKKVAAFMDQDPKNVAAYVHECFEHCRNAAACASPVLLYGGYGWKCCGCF